MIAEILQHKIKYTYFYYNMDLTESEEKHIKEMIIDGYTCGVLEHFSPEPNEENHGWWEMV